MFLNFLWHRLHSTGLGSVLLFENDVGDVGVVVVTLAWGLVAPAVVFVGEFCWVFEIVFH